MSDMEKTIVDLICDAIEACDGETAIRNDRQRPYDGQPHTDAGERGRQLVEGLTMRDICDCFVMAVLDITPLRHRVTNRTWRWDDLYEVEFKDIDPRAIMNGLTLNIERMMGIYPNIPKLHVIDDEPHDQEASDD